MATLALLDHSCINVEGTYKLRDICLNTALMIIQRYGQNKIYSVIGDKTTADILSTLLNIDVFVNEAKIFRQSVYQEAIIFKPRYKPIKNKYYNIIDIEDIGYSFQLLIRTA